MPVIFRNKPPLELVEQILETFGLKTTCDKAWFTKPQIHLDKLEILLVELEPYYMPCMAVLTPLTQSRALTILRQILREYGISIKSVEKSTGGKKQIWYSIHSTQTNANIFTVDLGSS